MTSGRLSPLRHSEFSTASMAAGKDFDRRPSLRPSIDSDMGGMYDSRSSIDAETRKPPTRSRRQSARPARQPQGPRQLTRSPSKLPTSGGMREATRTVSNSSVKSSAGGDQSRQNSFSFNMANFDPASTVPQSTWPLQSSDSQPFLPPVNFDDLHTSITLGEPGTERATSTKRSLISAPSLSSLKDGKLQARERQSMLPSTFDTLPTKSSDLNLQRSSTREERDNSIYLTTSSSSRNMPPPTAPYSNNKAASRRQSHFPTPASTTSLASQPRKSVGPGILTQSTSSYAFLQDEPQFNDRRQSSYRRRPSRNESAGLTEGADLRNGSLQSRSAKTRSAYSTYAPEDLLSTPTDGENPWNSKSRSPHQLSADVSTPGSSRRMSMNPAVVGGLGARTISPTDVKRMKRLSMMQSEKQSPSLTAQEMPPPFPTHYIDSPSIASVRRKSTTPSSSNRNTPDGRRSHRGSISAGQNSTQGILLNTGSSRRDSASATPKSPTLKARSENADNTIGDVPPVPAIPKAYESPKNEQDMVFAATAASRRSIIASNEAESEKSGSPADFVSARSSKASTREPMRIVDTPNSSRGYADEMPTTFKNSGESHSGRKKRDPPRLPPLNLLPLSAPTAEKIAAIQNRANASNSGTVTPPRKNPRTPTTPMTASRVNFAKKDSTAPIPITARSTTSQFENATEYSSYRPPSSAASSIKGEEKEKTRMSPFISSSAPKSSGEFGSIPNLRHKASVDRSFSGAAVDLKSAKLAGPRVQPSSANQARRSSNANAVTDSEAAMPTSSFGSNIRRKLSLNRKASTSRVNEQPPQPPAHNTMPPPRLPASATSNNASKTSLLATRRKSSIPEGIGKQGNLYKSTNGDAATQDVPRKSFEYKTLDPKMEPSSTARVPVANGRISRYPQPVIDGKLDRDDMIAEGEMQKLALRRKKTEIEARELDALRKRAVPAERSSPMWALRSTQLNVFERGEIIDYTDVYFTGTAKAEKLVGNLEAEGANFGYDDDRGDYNIVLGDHLAYRYEVVDVLGKGSFGQVVRCIDHKTGVLVAIKIIRNKKRFHQQALVEVNILQKLKDWDPEGTHSMVSFTQSFYFRGHLCISTELLGMNLYEFIKVHEFRGFSLKLIRRFTKQMLNSLVLLKGKKVIHCDLKPENILLAHPAHSEIKVIDFGSSCMEHEKVYTYIQSRFYRSPEVILGMNYGMPIDMWSLGCILAELYTGYPIFPGENEQEQLACIMEVFGPPDKHLIEKSTRRKLFFDSLGKPRPVVSSKGKRRRPSSKTLQQALRCDDEAFLDFLTKCLRWDPEKRMRPDEAALHEFITGTKPTQAKSIRSSTTPNLSSVPAVKRLNSTSARPLPTVPDTLASGRPSLQGRAREISPVKAQPKRHSTVTATTFSSSAKRTTASASQAISGLPRPGAGRVASGKQPDLASAAAAIATAKRRQSELTTRQ